MIPLTRLNGAEMYLNADLIAMVESHHDTVVTLVDGKTFVVQQRAEDVVAAVIEYRAAVLAAASRHQQQPEPEPRDNDEPARILVLHRTEETS